MEYWTELTEMSADVFSEHIITCSVRPPWTRDQRRRIVQLYARLLSREGKSPEDLAGAIVGAVFSLL